MARPWTRAGRWRAIVAVAALYAVALQGFLVALRPPGAAAMDAICAPDRPHVPGQDGEPQDACCLKLLRCGSETGPAAMPADASVEWPRPPAGPVGDGRTAAGMGPTLLLGPFGARGPPAA